MSAAFFCICEDGYVYHPSASASLLGVLYHVETSFSRENDSNIWYTAFLQDRGRQRVPGNILKWRDIECQIETEDGFVKSDEAKELELAKDGIVLVAHIKARTGKPLTWKCPNAQHDGRAWVQLMAYLRDLDALGTHDAVKRYRPLRLV
jgi:hypothetical protein